MADRILTLHQLSLRDTDPVALVRAAAATGFPFVTVFLHPPAPQLDIFPRLLPGPPTRAFVQALQADGVQVHNVEALPFSGRTDPADYLPVLDHAAEIGARRATVLVYDRDLPRASDRLSQTCDAAAARGIALSIEFMAFSSLPTVGEAADFVRQSGHANLSLLVDPLHLARTGGSPAQLGALADTIGALQFCDAMLAPPEDVFREAVEDREIPGEGELPLQALLDATDPGLPLDVEVPMLRLEKQGLGPIARAQLLKRALLRYRL
ncbi:TIM barrel protein [Paracoccus sp. AS002]|uniref:sugar phosphate isomerase/epimerase family protein n=1 Tax=Paracoccus sp. AS002 TaxID=3019545 RepID=UPI0023E77A5B|nr:TIM barrel protein [Paracoccus sp. AS002]MDF3904305.1 TIM barrel protein [Paracoccus sp. AS002]